MKRARSVVRFLGKIEGLSVAAVLVVLYVAFIFTAPDVFLKWRIYMSFLQTVAPPLIAGIGLTLAIVLKVAALYSLPENAFWLVLPLAGAASRWLLLPAGRQPNARPGGLGEMFSKGLSYYAFLWGALPLIALSCLIGWQAVVIIAAAHLLAWLVFRLARARLGGMTGDVYGLLVELSELLVLIGFCVKGL